MKRVVKARQAGKVASVDKESARRLLDAYNNVYSKAPEMAPPVIPLSYTKASLVAGTKIAILKDQIKTARITWENKEIAPLLIALGLPEDAPLSVVTVEVFGNITSVFEQVGLSLAEIKKYTANNPQAFVAIESRQMKSRKALGQYRILRTSPLTELPFVCVARPAFNVIIVVYKIS